MAWNLKKIKAKMIDFFKEKKIIYNFDEEALVYKFELTLIDAGINIYPYITIKESNISFNVNVNQIEPKIYDYSMLNNFNVKSKLFKAYCLENIITLEYNFVMSESLYEILESLLEQLFVLQKDIDLL